MRKQKIQVYLNDAELSAIRELASVQRCSISQLAHAAITNQPPPPAPKIIPAVNRDSYLELSRIGNNLNQIAAQLNKGGSVQAQALVDAINKLATAIKITRQQLIGSAGA